MSRYYTPKTGIVWLRDFDSGVVKQLNPVLIDNNYFVNFTTGLNSSSDPNVQVIFAQPEQVYEFRTHPIFLVRRNSMQPDLQRWHSYGQFSYREGVPGTERVVDGETVFDQVEMKPSAWPYNINYTISCYSRYEYEAQTLLRHILRSFQPRGHITVVDSLSENRGYTFFSDPDVQDLGEIIDVADRIRGYAVNVIVEGEIDLVDPVVRDTVQDVVVNSDPY